MVVHGLSNESRLQSSSVEARGGRDCGVHLVLGRVCMRRAAERCVASAVGVHARCVPGGKFPKKCQAMLKIMRRWYGFRCQDEINNINDQYRH